MNVLIEFNKMRLIAEIQFLLSFMLEAKKLGHAFYAFQRKKEYYENLYKLNNYNNYNINVTNVEFIEKLLQTPILCQNKNIFSKLLHLLSDSEMKGLKTN